MSPSTFVILAARGLSRVNDHKTAGDIGISSFIQIFQLIGASVLAGFVTQRVRFSDFTSVRHIREINLPRLYLALLFFTAWFYFLVTGLVLRGIGPSNDIGLCTAGLYISAGSYALSKVFVYLFLAERAYVVWCPTTMVPRHRNKVYMVCLTAILLYVGVICHLFVVRISRLREDGMCMIGFRLDAVILLLVYDVCVSLLMTGLFVWPLVRTHFYSPAMRHIARRSVTAASIVLSVSCVNIIVLAVMHGQERGFICLVTWEADVFLGSIALFWLTAGNGLRPMVSVLQEARSHPDSASASSGSHSKRRDAPLPALPFISRPENTRQSSLPTIMTHGMTYEDSASALATPGAVVVNGECKVWSPQDTTSSLRRASAGELEISEKQRLNSAGDEKYDC